MNPILLDTHAALWAFDGKLKREPARLVESAASRGELMVSPITAWEIGLLVHKRRLTLALTVEDFVRVLFSLPGVVLAALTPSIAVAATALPEDASADPADRILIATAAAYGARFVTRNREIHAFAKATSYLRCVPC
jgi:PIN domain nuclease of toxin-antitoxin system